MDRHIQRSAASDGKRVTEEKPNTSSKVFAICSLLLGAWIMYIDISSYWGGFGYAVQELTFWSNLLAGILLISSAVLSLSFGKRLPNYLYFAIAVLLMLVAGVSLAFGLNFKNGFQFLHLINPLAFLLLWLIGIDCTKDRFKVLMLAAATPPLVYLVIAMIFMSGYYPFLSVAENGVWGVARFVGIVMGILMAFAAVLIVCNKLVHRYILK